MARRSFRANPGDERTMVQLPDSANDLPELVSVDLDAKDPEAFEIVVNDDTPEGDRGRPTEWNDESALDQKEPKNQTGYAKRIGRLKAEIETRRRAEEAAQRERDAAAQLAADQAAEIARLRKIAETGSTALASSMKTERESRIADAKRRLAQAHAEGNSEEMATATADLTTATAELAQINARAAAPRPAEQQPERQTQQPPAQNDTMHPNARAWIQRNPKFNTDEAFRAKAMSIHYDLAARRIPASDPRYVEELDKRMGTGYEEPSAEENGSRPRRTNAVEQGGRENGVTTPPNPRRVELTQSELSLAKRLRLTPQQYAAEKLKYAQKGGA